MTQIQNTDTPLSFDQKHQLEADFTRFFKDHGGTGDEVENDQQIAYRIFLRGLHEARDLNDVQEHLLFTISSFLKVSGMSDERVQALRRAVAAWDDIVAVANLPWRLGA